MCKTCNKSKCCCVKTKVINRYGPAGKNAKSNVPGPPGPIGPSQVIIANTAFVSKNGNDSTALVERFDKPFLTITAATDALNTAFSSRSNSNRVRVVVFDGKYTETKIALKKYIDYDFGNAVINSRLTDDNVDMGSSAATDWTNIVYGNARLYNESTVTPGTLLLYKPNTKILINCNEIGTAKFEAIAIANGSAKIICNRIYTDDPLNNYSPAIELLQGQNSGVDFTLSTVEIIGADIYNVSTSNSCTIQFNEGGASKNQTLILRNCRVKNENANSVPDTGRSVIGCGIVDPSNGRLVLYNTILYSKYGKSIYVDSGDTLVVFYYNTNMTNIATGGSGTLTTSLGSLTVNSAVLPEF